ncbi:formate dehydrogenase subunit delta [Pseudomonas sp. C27(2019)]|uniref:formate dehydrogenase subunit delta n=1 Tax=Pseudomonas sp. C27(2019) TaxID=2604941 RepID=UPI0012454C3B|nr:formate dehydrogenase subunit delta [Pseudomonas sp. C27(2019)]QEY58888.1 formate dehydrogenase subunit delta [Pseudomonas sp. C27(2019)]
MSEQQLNNLLKMLEHIIANNLHHGDDAQVATVVADHLHKFWARSMKQLILNYDDANPAGLSVVAQLSLAQLQAIMADSVAT